jgi:hypothetical protein
MSEPDDTTADDEGVEPTLPVPTGLDDLGRVEWTDVPTEAAEGWDERIWHRRR